MKEIIFDFDWVIHNTMNDLHKIHCSTLENISLEEMKKNVFEWNSREYAKKFTKEEMMNFEKNWILVMQELQIKKNIKNILENINKKYNLYIISSNTELNLNKYFKNNNCIWIFKSILWAETHSSKIEKFKLLFKKYNFNEKNSIFITDTLWDILEANHLKIKTIAVDFWFHERERLEKWNPYKIVSKFEEIETEIEKLN